MTDTNDVAGVPTPEPVLPQDQPPAQPTPTDPAPADTPAPDPAGEPQDPPAPDPDGKPKSGWQRNKERLEREAREKLELRIENDRLTREHAAARTELQKLKQPDPTDPGPKPVLGQNGLDDVDAWFKAVDDWADKTAAFQADQKLSARAREQQQLAAEEAEHRAVAAVAARDQAVAAKYPDYAAAVGPFIPRVESSAAQAAVVRESDHGVEVFYHLSKHPAVLQEVLALPPFAANRRLLALEARLLAPPPPKPLTTAPAPLAPVGSQAAVSKSLGDLAAADDIAAYVAAKRRAKPK